ncbi:MAG: hypothetical protein HY926_08025 [Elusimicrobia bacterium]|nr:hypothetical protein [Elusimicrobiota bacterium]
MTWALLAVLLAAPPARAQEDGTSARPGLIKPGGLTLFYNSEGPLSFATPTPGDLPPGAKDAGEVRGRTCQHGLSIPVTASIRPTTVSGAAGNGGYQKTLAAMLKDRPDLAGIYDVKVDIQTLSILGFYRRVCTEILARGFRLGS